MNGRVTLAEQIHIKGPVLVSHLYGRKKSEFEFKGYHVLATKQSNIESIDCLKGLIAHAFGDHCMRHAQAV